MELSWTDVREVIGGGPTYPKINSMYTRDNRGKLQRGSFCMPEFEYLYDVPWRWTEKVDGTNIRIHVYPDGDYRIAGRTDAAEMYPGVVEAIHELIGPPQERRLAEVFEHEATLYGEAYGGRIQSVGKLYGDKPRFVMFDIRCGGWWLEPDSLTDVAKKTGIPLVPLVAIATPREAELLVKGNHFASEWGEQVRPEGLVGTTLHGLLFRNKERIMTKIKYRDYAGKGE